MPPVLSALLSVLLALCDSGLGSVAKDLLEGRRRGGVGEPSPGGAQSVLEMLMSLRLGGDAMQARAAVAFLAECLKLSDEVGPSPIFNSHPCQISEAVYAHLFYG